MRLLTIAVALCAASTVRADNIADADAAFAEGVKLRQAGNTKEACAKFAIAFKLNPEAVGVLLNVALCDEDEGKYASAMRMFAHVRDLAREHGQDPQRVAAEEHLQKNEPLIAHLAIAFVEQPPDATLAIDGEIVSLDNANDIAVDPGERTVVVSAPGRVAYAAKIVIYKTERKAIAVPALGYPVTVKRTRVTYGKAVTLGGAGLVAVGIGLGLYARSMYRSQFTEIDPATGSPPCQADDRCSGSGYVKTHNALTLGNVGTGVAVTGIVAIGVGAYLWIFAPRDHAEHRVAIVPSVAADGAGVVAIGRF